MSAVVAAAPYEAGHTSLGPGPGPIRILSRLVAERIAAGEVIERPASVVRELLDNAIDAGSSEISIELRGSGLELIRVSDDGCGIPSSEVELAFERHATSKLCTEADLLDLETLGFRGEALPSLAAVADVTMLTRAIGAPSALSVELRGGEVVRRAVAARQRGTTVSVRQLFRTVPARLKFLPAGRTESLVVSQLVRRAALAHPAVRFSLIVDGHLSFRSSGSGDLRTACQEVFGDELSSCLTDLIACEPGIVDICGLLSGRTATRPNRNSITLVVNGRAVTNADLMTALEGAYRPLLPRGRHPIALIVLDLPRGEVDPNVHPTKSEVRMARQSEVAEILARVVHEALTSAPAELDSGADFSLIDGQRRLALRPSRVRETPRRPWGMTGASRETPDIPIAELRVVAQVQGALILAEGPGGLYLVDQHRAHERAIFERLLARDQGNEVEAQSLLDPLLIELSQHQATRLDERLPELARIGFVVERFGERAFLVRAIPAVTAGGQLADYSELLEESAADGESWRQRLLISLACRSAIRRQQALALVQMEGLLHDLAQVNVPAACPHGSPLLLHVGQDFLARQFGW